MSSNAWIQIALYIAVLVGFARPLGWLMARIYQGKPLLLDRIFYKLAGVDPNKEMGWRQYAGAVLVFNLLGVITVYTLMRWQAELPLNPQKFDAASPDLAFNTAISFATNTNWQSYGGENTISYLVQMLALAVQNFLSAATGMAVLIALIRGLARHSSETIGNFWVDVTKSTLYILLPLSAILALVLVSQGVIQNFKTYDTATVLQPFTTSEDQKDADGKPVLGADGKPLQVEKKVTEQTLPMGPAASQIAIKQLGTNGGGFFNTNSAHPYENPTPLSNFLQVLSILLIPGALCYTYGLLVNDRRQGWAILAAMLIIFIPCVIGTTLAEQSGVPKYAELGADGHAGNMEGKETRFGITNSALWAVATTAASNGSVNSMHDSYTPLGGLIPLWLMQLGEVVFGGVGSGLYGMIIFAVLAVFVAGLMVGRTPEYLGKKIEAFEMKMASLVILIPPALVLIGTAAAVNGGDKYGLKYTDPVTKEVKDSLSNTGAHGFSEVLYAFSSAANNNGSAFAGLNANEPFYNTVLAVGMLISRFWLIIPVLAIAGSLARKKYTPPGPGSLPTHTPLFVVMLVGVVLLVGALTFVPALALGPIVEHLQMK
ncbi:potassium-transporting ATPase subunit KdpA [Telmatocola sphagniphila]|uniref:Potassium-transporting ATPase potassium-binding subunit n=1 Tax=Telmatocola sphagniphila TaxID=1123043 RepID=A0A8E6B7L5_9BACT|nr:potassium-transporting ATPase subunit KdpA [Telmatocola sphagniphila]QVL31895.1 potassium-transporting ATPase subunit KdpA [Telmatocola sphagniphila]